jgi:hypothetical protein
MRARITSITNSARLPCPSTDAAQVHDAEPAALKAAALAGKGHLDECEAAAATTRQQHAAGASAVQAACADVGLARPNRPVRRLVALAEASHRAAAEAAAECVRCVARAGADAAAGLEEGAAAAETGRDCLDSAAELAVEQTLGTADRLLLRAANAADTGLLAGGASKVRVETPVGGLVHRA